MEGYSRKEEKCNNKVLFDLVPKESEWAVKKEGRSHGVSEEKKLELRLGPPDGDWCVKNSSKVRGRDDSSSSHLSFTHNFSCATAKRGFLDPPVNGAQPHQFSSFLQLQSPSQCMHVRPQEPSQPGCSKGVDLNSSEKMAFSPPAVPNTSQKRFLFSHCFVLLSGQIMFTVLVVLAQLFVKSFISVADNGFEDYPFL